MSFASGNLKEMGIYRSLKIFLIVLAMFFISSNALAWRGRARGGPVYVANWQHGYWFHGAYVGRPGWWWVVGPTWYYYPAPVYPYPTQTVAVYSVQVPGAPPPPATVVANAATPGSPMAPPPPPPPPAKDSAPATKQQAMTYYCEKTKSYYPLVNSCDGAWIATPAPAPGQ